MKFGFVNLLLGAIARQNAFRMFKEERNLIIKLQLSGDRPRFDSLYDTLSATCNGSI